MAEFCDTGICNVFVLIITALQLGQFIPQHYEMAVDKSTIGVSPWLLFFSSLYTYLAALDILLLDAPTSITCNDTRFRCFIRDQPIIQLIGSAILSITMWYWFLKYYNIDDIEDPEDRKLDDDLFYSNMQPTTIFNLFVFVAMAFNMVSFYLVFWFGFKSVAVESFAQFCGFLSAILNGMMWIPQIIFTYKYGHKGVLSLGWVLASVIMDITYSTYSIFMGVHWSVWANNIPDGIETGILAIMLVYFEYRDEKRGLDDYGHAIRTNQQSSQNVEIETDSLVRHNHSKDNNYLTTS